MSEDKEKSYLDDIKIEPDALDLEWLHQPVLYMKWAEKAAQAEDKVKICKEKLEVVDAQLDKEIRTTSQEKITEGFVKSRIALDQRHQEALQKLNDAIYRSNLFSAAVKAMEHKKTSLENLVRLWAGQYFAGPVEGRDLRRDMAIKDRGNVQARDKIRAEKSKKVSDNGKNN